MLLQLNNREVEATVDRNDDGSRFLQSGYYVDTGEILDDSELDELQELYDDSEDLNGLWG